MKLTKDEIKLLREKTCNIIEIEKELEDSNNVQK